MIGNSWDSILDSSHLNNMLSWVREKRAAGVNVLPCDDDIFRSFQLTPYEKVKVVILGQDPYPGTDKDGAYHAMGMSFSSRSKKDVPASLKNVFKELYNEYGFYNITADLTPWAEQGVLLLNTVLTVEAGCPNSHKNMGWEPLTTATIKALGHSDFPIVFMLWGAQAQMNELFIRKDNGSKLVLKAIHPSPLSANRGFFGCNHFRSANEFLTKNGIPPIEWAL